MRTHTLFLTKTEPPTKPGWYWGRYFQWKDIRPLRVEMKKSDNAGYEILVTNFVPVTSATMEWFGPLPEVREASNVG